MGVDDAPVYGFDLNNAQEVEEKTQELINYWYNRWAINRCETIDLRQRLTEFNLNHILIGNI